MKISNSIVKFGFTGVMATLIHIAVVSVLVPFYGVDVGAANAVAFIIATMFSNYLNTKWSFESTFTRKTIIRFWIVAILGCFMSVLISKWADLQGFHYLEGVALVVITVPVLSFILHRNWTFSRSFEDR